MWRQILQMYFLFEPNYVNYFFPKLDLEKNQQTQQELAIRAAHGKLIQMIAQHCEKNYQGELDYHFTYDNKVKRIDYTLTNLIAYQPFEGDSLFSDLGDSAFIPAPLKSFPIVHYKELQNVK